MTKFRWKANIPNWYLKTYIRPQHTILCQEWSVQETIIICSDKILNPHSDSNNNSKHPSNDYYLYTTLISIILFNIINFQAWQYYLYLSKVETIVKRSGDLPKVTWHSQLSNLNLLFFPVFLSLHYTVATLLQFFKVVAKRSFTLSLCLSPRHFSFYCYYIPCQEEETIPAFLLTKK